MHCEPIEAATKLLFLNQAIDHQSSGLAAWKLSSILMMPISRSTAVSLTLIEVRVAASRRLGYDRTMITAHGFRGMASTLLHECEWLSDVIERQLSHAGRNAVKAAYNHAEHLPARRKMTQAWADRMATGFAVPSASSHQTVTLTGHTGPGTPYRGLTIREEGPRRPHTYSDHASILKFIEANWRLPPVSSRSRDNLPNPIESWNTDHAHRPDRGQPPVATLA